MYLSAESVNLRRKRTATDRAINNRDRLVVRKKAHEAVPKNSTNVSLHRVRRAIFDHYCNRELTLVVNLLSIWKMAMKILI
jgi:hypothetical protein